MRHKHRKGMKLIQVKQCECPAPQPKAEVNTLGVRCTGCGGYRPTNLWRGTHG